MLDFAVSVSKRSTCSRLQVGCVITSPDHAHILAYGYNGGAKGLTNACKSDKPGKCGHLHAEINACIKAPADVPKVVYLTHAPCELCAISLINLGGVKSVEYISDFRSSVGLDLLEEAKIPVLQVWE